MARAPHEVDYGELPELARALRALGSSRRSAGALQALFFRTLIDARRKAAAARTPTARVRAFDADELAAGLERSIARIVADWPDARESAKRALGAQLAERTREYTDALAALRVSAAAVESAAPAGQLDAWRAWTVALQHAFHGADRSWLAIRAVVDNLTAKRRT